MAIISILGQISRSFEQMNNFYSRITKNCAPIIMHVLETPDSVHTDSTTWRMYVAIPRT